MEIQPEKYNHGDTTREIQPKIQPEKYNQRNTTREIQPKIQPEKVKQRMLNTTNGCFFLEFLVVSLLDWLYFLLTLVEFS